MSRSARLILSAFAVLGLSAGASAQEETPRSGEAKTASTSAFPFQGEVTCEWLNVRFQPKNEPGQGIASVLKQGEKVTVMGESGDYWHILPPKGTTVWIYGRQVKKDSATEGTVFVNDAAVRMDSRVNAEKLATLDEGARVKILKEHLGWFQIAAPEAVKYWVAKKFVRNAGPAEVKTAGTKPAPDADAEAKALIREAERLIEEQNQALRDNRIEELDYSAIIQAYEAAAKIARNAEMRRIAEQGAKNYREFQAILVGVKANLKAVRELVEAQKAALEEKHRAAEKKWDMVGYVDMVGPILNRPGAYKLVMGEKIVCFISVKDGDDEMRARLNRCYEKYVGIKGVMTQNPTGWAGYSVVAIADIEEIPTK